MATWQAGRAARGCVGRLRGGDLLFWERPCSVFFPLVFALCSFFFVLIWRGTLPSPDPPSASDSLAVAARKEMARRSTASTSVHHLVDKLGEELGYIMAADTGWDC